MKNFTVNEKGLAEIRQFLSENHKLGGNHFDKSMLLAWAKDAEFSLGEGNQAIIEIISYQSSSGHTVTFTVSNEGIDWEEFLGEVTK